MDDVWTVREHLMAAASLISERAKLSLPPSALSEAAATAERAIEAMLALLAASVLSFEPEILQ